MSGKIVGFLREYVLIFSTILTLIGLFILGTGATGIWFKKIPQKVLNLSKGQLEWSPYLIIIGFIILAIGIWYLYSYWKNKKFILEELETNKRSELLKKHGELKRTVRHMPKKYQKMLKDKEEELKIK